MLINRLQFYLGNKYQVKQLTQANVAEIFALQQEHDYYQYFQTTKLKETDILTDLTLFPEKSSLEHKFYLGIYHEGKLLAVLDLLLGYPEPQITWLGLLMISKHQIHQGVGRMLMEKLAQTLLREGFKIIGTAVPLQATGALKFFEKLGFLQIGMQTAFTKEGAPFDVILLTKELDIK